MHHQTAVQAGHRIEAVVFDLHRVLIDWSPRYLYRKLLPNDAAIDRFFREVGFVEWNTSLDVGLDWDLGVDSLSRRHPDRRQLIAAFRDRWEETLGGPIAPVVEILEELRANGVRTFALSNWSRRTYDLAASKFAFLRSFEAIVISGDVGSAKPDAKIYHELLDRGRLQAQRTVFVDDKVVNVNAARALGMIGIEYNGPSALRAALAEVGLPLTAACGDPS